MATPQVVVRSDGADGFHGSKLKTNHNCAPFFGGSGRNGYDATAPSNGGAGGNIFLELSRSVKPGYFDVRGYGNVVGFEREVPHGHNLFVSACGGDGGEGGWGEGGQNGGDGWSGSNASQWSSAGNGHHGGNGGNAGYGTDGGNGGDGGQIEITVREDDMDLLIALEWEVDGGNGGPRGIHGVPGIGGRGGRGGDGIKWVDESGFKINSWEQDFEHRNRPAGNPGRNGYDGAAASTFLQDGAPGGEGSIRFVVIYNDGTTSTYQSIYDLRIESWMLQDENDDGIFEPGEHIMVRKIKVRNYGEMPSPTKARIPFSMLPSTWLDFNVEQDEVFVPPSVPGFTTVEVPGMIMGLIKPEDDGPRPPEALRIDEAIQLMGIMPRINRPVPKFQAICPFVVQYPLQLVDPIHVEAVALGDQFSIQWTVVNISKRSHGIDSDLRRTCCTRICTDRGFFEFEHNAASSASIATIGIIGPMKKLVFEQSFQVSEKAEPFTKGYIWLHLMLSPPSYVQSPLDLPLSIGAVLHPISSFNLPIQVSPKFQFNHGSSFLLIVNAGTSGDYIRQFLAFVQQTLYLEVDVYNISLHESFMQPSGDNVLMYYSGKTIIVSSNLFTYSGTLGRSTHEFINPIIAARLLSAGTTFLFLGLENTANLTQHWGQMVANPIFPLDETGSDGSLHGLAFKPFVETLEKKDPENGNAEIFRTHSVPIKKPFLRKGQNTTISKAKKLAKVLALRYPLRNFICRTLPSDGSKKPPLAIMIHETLPLSARILVSSIPCNVTSDTLGSVFQYLIVAALPFEHRARVFWKLAPQAGSEETISPGFLRLPELHENPIMELDQIEFETQQMSPHFHHEETQLTTLYQIERSIYSSIQYDLLQEISYFSKPGPRFSDPINNTSLPSRLPCLSTFFQQAPKTSLSSPLTTLETSTWFTYTFTQLQVATLPTLFGKSHARKKLLSKHLQTSINTTLTTQFGPSTTQTLLKTIKTQHTPLKKEIKKLRKSPQKAAGVPTPIISCTSNINQTMGFPAGQQVFLDVGVALFKSYRTRFATDKEFADLRDRYEAFRERLTGDEERSQRVRMVLVKEGVRFNALEIAEVSGSGVDFEGT